MKDKYTSLKFKARVEPIKPVNDEFTLCKVYVQSVGKNRNGTYMSKDNIQQFLPTLNYCPVVGHLIEYKDNEGNIHRYIGGHDWEITEDWEIKDLTVPYGVVVENSYDFEIVNEYGIDVEYLTANAILWTGRYPELYDTIYSDEIWFNQSMEIKIPDGKYRPLEEDSNYMELLEWSYSALCMLGKADKDSTNDHTDSSEHTEPCFISAKILPLDFAKSEFTEIMNEMKDKLSFCFNNQSSTTEEVDIENDTGGNSMATEMVNEVVEEVTETETVVEETVTGEVETETVENEFEADDVDESDEETVDEVTEETTDETDEVVEEETETEAFTVEMYNELKGKYESLEQEFSDYKAEHSFLNSEYEELKSYKESKEADERDEAEKALFSKFEKKIGSTVEFKELKKNAGKYSIDDLKKECLCIVGLYATADENDGEPTDVSFRFSVEKPETDDEPYGGVIKKYLKR